MILEKSKVLNTILKVPLLQEESRTETRSIPPKKMRRRYEQ
jgi:hypothetical protein